MPELSIASQAFPPALIVTARSYLVDRFVPDVEIIARPAGYRVGGTLTWRSGEIVSAPPASSGRLKGMLPTRARETAAPEGRWVLDLRDKAPDNWAHFLNNHLPLAFGVAEAAGVDPGVILALLPAAVPSYIEEAAALFGLTALATDDVITGHGLEVTVAPWTALRAIRHRWVRLPGPSAAIAALAGKPANRPLPRKVFLARKDSRALVNAAEIEALLTARGFETVYPETLSPGDQIRLFLHAEEVVAIHGAGLAPLLYCMPGQGPARLIELLPCGHMTDVYREMSGHVGCRWIGVRGRIKPEYIRPAYRLDKPFKEFSLDGFAVDPVSLEHAFDLSERQTDREPT